MKLIDFLKFDVFNRLRSQMDANLVDTFHVGVSSVLTIADLEEMATSGKDIDSSELRVLEDGTLAYKDSRVLLHIRDVGLYRNRDPEDSLPRFHVADCKTLHEMKRNKRFDRYVVSIRTDGKFDLNFIRNNREKRELRELQVCMNCLDHLAYKGCDEGVGYHEKRKVRDEFSIDEYFEIYPRSLFISNPKYTSADAPVNSYPSNWNEISSSFRHSIGYKCQNKSCGVELVESHHRKYLHVHHKNGLKHDCSPSNLEALCIYCHGEEFMHAHVKVTPDYKDFLPLRARLLKLDASQKPSRIQEVMEVNAGEQKYIEARRLAATHKVEVEDFRSKKGAFWVNHDRKSDGLATALSKLGFQYHAGRGWWKK